MPSSSPGLQAVRAFDSHHQFRSCLSEIAVEKAAWAGIPMPLSGERLVIEPTYPWAQQLGQDWGPKAPEADEDKGWQLVNSWWCRRWRCEILIMRDPQGRIVHGKRPAFHHVSYDLSTMGCSEAWGIEQEQRALQLLGGMIRHHAFKKYLLTGMFLERSERSGVTYMFRRLKPTVAIAPARDDESGMRILASLCMHPIAYYAGSWAGAMCPTDDVIAHLSLMRADEHMFWKRCNQHHASRPEAGL